MGGYGSGRTLGCRELTSDYRRIDIRALQRAGRLEPGPSFSLAWSRNGETIGTIGLCLTQDRLVLSYSHRRNDDPWERSEYPVFLEWTRCNYGGRRAWFRCPRQGCHRRVAMLYGPGIFACRHCRRLAFQSQRDAPSDRALGKAQAILERLGGSGSMAERFPDRPKGMHSRTYWRLAHQFQEAQGRSYPPWLLNPIRPISIRSCSSHALK